MKLRKLLAVILAVAMVMSISMTCFVDDATAAAANPITVTPVSGGNKVVINDDFSSYNATNSAYTSSGAVTSGMYSFHTYWPGNYYYDGLFNSTRAHSPVGNPATVAQTSYGHYETSVAYNGAWFHDNRVPGMAYIGADGALYVDDNYSYGTAVNFDVEGAKVTDVVKIKARTKNPGGIRILVSGDEKSFYEIGRPKGDNAAVYNVTDKIESNQSLAVGGTSLRAPYFSKVKDGLAVKLDTENLSTTSTTNTNVPVLNDAGSMYIDSGWNDRLAETWAELELSIDLGSNKVNWTMKKSDGYVWSGSFCDEELSDMIDATVYPFAFFSSQENAAIFDDVEAEFTTEAKPTYYTDFDGITRGANAAYTMQEAKADGKYGTYKAGQGDVAAGTADETYIYAKGEIGNPQTILTSNGADLILSGKRLRTYGNAGYGKAIYNETTDAIMLSGKADGDTSINFKPHNSDDGFDSISNVGVKFTYDSLADTARILDFLVNKDENSYYQFGFRDMKPFVKKVGGSSGALTVYDYTTDAEVDPAAVEPLQMRTVQYLYVSIDEKTNTVYLTCKHDADNVFTWYFKDEGLASMIENTAYPMAISINGDGCIGFSKVFATYRISGLDTQPKDLVVNNNNGTSLVNIQPALYEGATSLTVIAAYYDGTTDELLGVEIIPVTNMAGDTEYIVTHNTTAGSYGKLSVWKGDIAEYYPLASADLY